MSLLHTPVDLLTLVAPLLIIFYTSLPVCYCPSALPCTNCFCFLCLCCSDDRSECYDDVEGAVWLIESGWSAQSLSTN